MKKPNSQKPLKMQKTNQLPNKSTFSNQISQNDQNAEKENEELLTITINLSASQEENIIIHRGDNPQKLASDFCKKYGLKPEQQKKLAQKINQHIAETLCEKTADNQNEIMEKSDSDDDFEDVGEEHTEDLQTKVDLLKRNTEIFKLSNIHEKYGTNSVKKGEWSPAKKFMYTEIIELDPTEWDPKKIKSTPSKKGKGKTIIGFGRGMTIPINNENNITEFNEKTLKTKNFGNTEHFEKMYNTAMAKKRQKDRIAKEKQRLREIEEMQYATFHPETNHNRRNSLLSRITKIAENGKAQDRLYKNAVEIQEKLESAKMEFLVKQRDSCPFMPKINNKYFSGFSKIL